ncbi:MAG: calcium-binding protein [Chloroflexota bacterium]
MEQIKRNEEIEDRIAFDVVVDAKDADEVAMGWYYYVGENAQFPFRAQCIEEKSGSPLKLNESVNVTDIASGEDCANEIRVLVELMDRTLSVPLAQLKPIDVDKETAQIVDDWHYWVGRGYTFRW